MHTEDSSAEEDRFRDAIANDPRDLLAYRELAARLLAKGRMEQAVSILAAALRIDYRDVPTLIAFAHAQRKWGNNDEAEQACLLALEEEPERPDALAALAHVLIAREKVADAIPILEKSLRLQPDNIEARRLYGAALGVVGRFEDARSQLFQVIARDPGTTSAYASLSEIETFTADHDLLPRMHAVLARAQRPDEPRLAPLYYALGKAYDDIGDYERAFGFFETGARLQRSLIEYDEVEALAILDDVMAVFTPTLLSLHPPTPAPHAMRPVFIVGMPRSGSTLLEQILSRHPDVYCAGETTTFGEKLAMVRRDSLDLPLFPALMRTIGAESLARVSSAYRMHMHERGAPACIFVNKLLSNFLFVGAIHMAMPDARFIVAKRNALDTCVSAFTNYFGSNIPHSYDLGELGRFYRKCEQVIAHWEQVLPDGVMRTINYEEVVSDIETQARSLLDFLGLAWDPACLTFHRSSRPVRTASVAQVRRPLYQNSVGHWRRYERHLQPLVDALSTEA